jgi:hypothetical protein
VKRVRPLLFWLQRVETLIAEHTTTPRTRGKYKGHGSTDSVAWVQKLVVELQAEIKRMNGRSIAYDENMALAHSAGLVLSAWYFNVHRAKTLDPNRPLALRRKAGRRLADRRAALLSAITDDVLMSKVWAGQQFALPYGRGARGGKFV